MSHQAHASMARHLRTDLKMTTSSSLPLDAPHYSTFETKAQSELFRLMRKARLEDKMARPPIPIFVITCDRLTALIKALLSYHQNLDHPITIIIHDNSTTYPPTLQFLARLQEEGIEVHYSSKTVFDASSLNTVRNTVHDWFSRNDASHYIVTDPDIEIEPGAEKLVDACMFLLAKYAYVDVAGPMLRRDDIPDHYPLKARVHQQQGELYLPEKQWIVRWDNKPLMLQSGWIDTAFGFYRKGFRFKNLNRAVQTLDPFVAKHSDWYLNPLQLAPDQIFYKAKNNPVGHWGSTFLPDHVEAKPQSGKDMNLKSSYRIVRAKPKPTGAQA